MSEISIILPTYNERGNIKKLIGEIFKNLQQDIEIMVVDDNSPDGTWEVVKEISQRDRRVKLLRRMGRRGLTTAISEGISLAEGEVVLWMDCDFSMPPQVLPQLLKEIGPFDIALGSRYVEGGKDMRDSPFRVLISRIFDELASTFLGVAVKDLTSGFVAAKREVFETVSLSGDYGDYCIDFLYRALSKGFKVKEVPYTCVSRFKGETKTNPHIFGLIRHGVIYTCTVLKLRFSGGYLSKVEPI